MLLGNEPEYSLEKSEKTLLMESQRASLNQTLLDLEVDTVVLSRELTRLVDLSGRIANTMRSIRLESQEEH